MSKYVLDACALLAVLNKEDGGESVKEIIEQAKDDSTEVRKYKFSLDKVTLF